MHLAFAVAALLSGWSPTHDTPVGEESKPKPLKAPSQAIRDLPPTEAQVDAALASIAREHGVHIVWKDEGAYEKVMSWKPAVVAQVGAFVPTLRQGLANYPAGVFGKGRLENIVLASDLVREGDHVNGIAVREIGTLFINCSELWDAETVRHSLHHEIFHLLDDIPDEAWAKLSDPRFPYAPPSMQDWKEGGPSGFVSAYARSSPREDKAELFSMLVAEPSAVARRARGDEFVRGKVAALKNALEPKGLDAAFWNAARLPGR